MNGISITARSWRTLSWLRGRRRRFRVQRLIQRIFSPRRIIASSLTILFIAAYALSGVYILSARQPAAADHLVMWLSGGMVVYAIYHALRCAWSSTAASLQLTPAEACWLAAAPIGRADLTINQVAGLVPPAMLKTLLLAVVLARDVDRVAWMIVAVLISLVLLEIMRAVIGRWVAGLTDREKNRFRLAITTVAGGMICLAIATVAANTPLHAPTWMYAKNGLLSLGQVAASDPIQWLSLPWMAPARLALSDCLQWQTVGLLAVSLSLLPLASAALMVVDRWSSRRVHQREVDHLRSAVARGRDQEATANLIDFQGAREPWLLSLIPASLGSALAIGMRHWVSVRRYRWVITVNFLIPTLLCLSPLATGQSSEQWFYIVGGIALCTILLAPPALKIDFRRDLTRMSLLKSLPATPRSMVVGTLLAPVLITWIFQWITIAIGGWSTGTELSQVSLWTGMLNALAIFTFAAENALFLAYPHHEQAEGVAMIIRAKLTFLGKGSVLVAALMLLVLWSSVCRSLPNSLVQPAFILGAIAGSWGVALLAFATTIRCWQRFDLSIDIPPQ